MDMDVEIRARKERLAAALQEKQRRRNVGIERGADGWYDIETNEPLSDEAVMKREVAFERARPPAVDLENKVMVDREWLIATLGKDAYDDAMAVKHIQSLRSWL